MCLRMLVEDKDWAFIKWQLKKWPIQLNLWLQLLSEIHWARRKNWNKNNCVERLFEQLCAVALRVWKNEEETSAKMEWHWTMRAHLKGMEYVPCEKWWLNVKMTKQSNFPSFYTQTHCECTLSFKLMREHWDEIENANKKIELNCFHSAKLVTCTLPMDSYLLARLSFSFVSQKNPATIGI